MFFIEYGAIVGWLFLAAIVATWAVVARKAARKRKLANTSEEA